MPYSKTKNKLMIEFHCSQKILIKMNPTGMILNYNELKSYTGFHLLRQFYVKYLDYVYI